MPRPSPGNAHYVSTGKFGIVDSSLSVPVWNRWRGEASYKPIIWYQWNGVILCPWRLIPHGTLVLVIGPAVKFMRNTNNYHYHILWGEKECWICTDSVSPYSNEL